MSKSVFQQSALISGLLTQQDLAEAVASLIQAQGSPAEEGSAARAISDEHIANWLVDRGRLNRWQAGQLREGRTTFSLGPYQCIDSIGQGGMGQVFKAEHTIMGRVVAVKVLPRSKSTPEAIANFAREIRTQAQLDHHNLVRAYDAGHDRNVHFLVTEYVPGTDLRRLIRRQGRLSVQSASSIISQAAQGLAYAHSRGLIHRDVKPGNILVTPDGHTKVSDLGLAGYFNEPEQMDDLGGKVVGTADYLAPEQITAPDKPTPVSDIYSLGCTLYYAVTGKVPFPGGTPRDKARAHCQLAPLDPRRLNPDLSDDFVEVLADMMAKKPDERLQTATQVISRLAPWAGETTPQLGMEPTAVLVPLTASAAVDNGMSRRGPPAPLSDTEPNFLVQPVDEPGQGDSPSQMSLGTQPMGTTGEETLPVLLPERSDELWNLSGQGLSPLFKIIILIGIITAVGTLAAVIGGLIYTAMST